MKLHPLKTFSKYLSTVLFIVIFSSTLQGQIDFEILSGDAQICLGDSAQLSIETSMNIDSVVWSPTDGVSMPMSLTTNVSPSVSTTYFATLYMDDLTQIVRLQVDIFSSPDLGNDITVCSNGGSFMFDLNNVEFPTDYNLTNNGNFIISESSDNNFEVNINNTAAGTYDLIASSPDCNQVDSIQIIVLTGTAATLNFEDEDQTICLGSEVNFSVTPSSNQTYQWFANGIPISTSTSITDTPLETTTYVISTTGLSCVVPTRDSVTITVNNEPAISLPEMIQGCENEIIQLGNNINQSGTTYTWEPSENIIDPSVLNAQLLVTGDQTYVLTADNGCVVSETIEVEMIPNDLDIPVDTLFICKGESTEINWTTNPSNDDVVWSTINGIILTNIPSPFIVTPEDVTSYIGTVENNGCTFSDTITIQVDSLPPFLEVELIDMPPPVCMGDTVLLQTIPVFEPFLYPNITHEWYSGSGPSGEEFLTSEELVQLFFTAQETMQYNRIDRNGACIDTASITVEVVPILTVIIDPIPEICPGSMTNVIANGRDPITNMNIPTDEIEWEWEASGGSVEPADVFNPNVSVESTPVNLMVTATYKGCPAEGTATVPVAGIPVIVFPDVTQICLGESVRLNSGFVGPDYDFIWSSSANDLVGQENDPNPEVMPVGMTTYSVSVTNSATNGDECETITEAVILTVFDSAETLNENITASGCQGDSFTLAIPDDYQGGPNPIFTWTEQSSGSILSNDKVLDITNLQESQSYIIRVSNDCSESQEIGEAEITVTPKPILTSILCEPEESEYGEGEEITLSVESPENDIIYTWGSANQGSFSENPSPSTVYTATSTGQDLELDSDFITLLASTEEQAGGCTNEIGKMLSIIPAKIVLPNLFVPGVNNEIFRIRVDGMVDITNLQIFDRWGNKVYDNDNEDQEWDGTINGEPAPSEVYIYTVTYQISGQDPVTDSSDLTLLR